MKNIKKILALALVIMSVFAISAPALAATAYCVCPTDEYVRVRSSASSSASVVYYLHNGEPVTTTGTSGSYTKISSPVTGYVLSSFISTSTPAWMSRYGSKTMNLATRDQMRAFQTDLNSINGVTDVTVDGYWGPETEAAVEQLQAIAQITVDGIAGTYTKLWTYNLSH